jgi:hypothetical protein
MLVVTVRVSICAYTRLPFIFAMAISSKLDLYNFKSSSRMSTGVALQCDAYAFYVYSKVVNLLPMLQVQEISNFDVLLTVPPFVAGSSMTTI